MKTKLRMYWLTNLPAPYRLPIFSQLGVSHSLHVDFLLSSTNWRNWGPPNSENYTFSFLNLRCRKFSDFELVPNVRIRRKELFVSQVVVVGSWEAPQYLWTALVAKIMRKKLILIYESTLGSQRYKNYFVTLIRSTFFKMGDLILSFGIDSTQALLSMGVPSAKILQLFNPIPRIYPPKLESISKLDYHRYLFVGQLIDRKNVDALIHAFAKVRKKEDTLTIVGDGDNRDRLVKLVNGLHLERHVEFTGQIRHSEMNNLYPKYDTLVLPSLREVWGLVVNEALAHGLHVVVSNKCGCASLVKDMKGVYVTNGSSVSLEKEMTNSSLDFKGKITSPEIWNYDTFAFSRILNAEIDKIFGN